MWWFVCATRFNKHIWEAGNGGRLSLLNSRSQHQHPQVMEWAEYDCVLLEVLWHGFPLSRYTDNNYKDKRACVCADVAGRYWLRCSHYTYIHRYRKRHSTHTSGWQRIFSSWNRPVLFQCLKRYTQTTKRPLTNDPFSMTYLTLTQWINKLNKKKKIYLPTPPPWEKKIIILVPWGSSSITSWRSDKHNTLAPVLAIVVLGKGRGRGSHVNLLHSCTRSTIM